MIIEYVKPFSVAKLDFGIYDNLDMKAKTFDPFPRYKENEDPGLYVSMEKVGEVSQFNIKLDSLTEDYELVFTPTSNVRTLIISCKMDEFADSKQPLFDIRYDAIDNQKFSMREFLYQCFETSPTKIFLSNPMNYNIILKIIAVGEVDA